MKQEIEKMYDYIIDVVQVQRKLPPFEILYGDGTRWNNNKILFYIVYNEIKKVIVNNINK